jgi:hypothetical protein
MAAPDPSSINVGDEVMAKDLQTGEQGPHQVTQLHLNRDTELTNVTVSDRPANNGTDTASQGRGGRGAHGPTDSSILETTAHHPFWGTNAGEGVDAADLTRQVHPDRSGRADPVRDRRAQLRRRGGDAPPHRR